VKHGMLLLILVIMALVLVCFPVFGGVNQFIEETGLTVNALMLPDHKTVDTLDYDFANMVYAEAVIETNETTVATDNYIGESQLLLGPYQTGAMTNWAAIGIRLKGPLPSPFGG